MRMTPPVTLVLTVNRIMAGLVCLMTLLLLILQVDSSAIHRGKREVPRNPCPKLEFWSVGFQKCLKCHICGPGEEGVRKECKINNPQPIAHYGDQGAWCDYPYLPLPECPPLPEYVSLSNKSPGCNKDNREYAPGCQCTIGCGGKKSLALHCTQNLTWSGATENEIEECQVITTTTLQPPTTEAPPEVEKGGNTLVVVLSSAIALTILIATIVLVIVVTCVCKRRQRKRTSTSNQSSALSSENSSETGADSPLISKRNGASVESPVSQSIRGGWKGEVEAYTGASAQPSTVTSHQVVREVPISAPGDNSKEENAFQTRQAEPEFPKAVLCMGLSEKQQGNDQRNALKEFLKSRNELKKFTKMFDQKYSLGRISWHDVAQKLLKWNLDDVKSSEYLLRPNTSSSPGDGPMYTVLKEALHEGKGLLDLLRCLKSFPYQNFTAEKQLEDFWVKWKAKHAGQ